MTTKFYFCPVCGNLVMMVMDSGAVPSCCGQQMEELKPHTHENPQGQEAHLPVVTRVDACSVKVSVGAKMHPALDTHHIVFVYVETPNGGIIRFLEPTQQPEVTLCTCDNPTAAYAYCNIHGLWKSVL